MPSVGFTNLQAEGQKPIFGKPLRTKLRHEFGGSLVLTSVGGMIPNDDCRCEIDPNVKDRWGVPALRFFWKPGSQEIQQARHAVQSMKSMMSAMGGSPRSYKTTGETEMLGGGEGLHEVGTARMGRAATDSVLSPHGNSWDVRNLYIADGASFASSADKNPTLTIMALAWRASDHLADSLIRREI